MGAQPLPETKLSTRIRTHLQRRRHRDKEKKEKQKRKEVIAATTRGTGENCGGKTKRIEDRQARKGLKRRGGERQGEAKSQKDRKRKASTEKAERKRRC